MTHAQAREIVKRAWRLVHGRDPSENELTITQAIAKLETGYGRIGQFAKMASQGKYNWGALQKRPDSEGNCPTGTAPGLDQGNVCFYVYPSDEEAAAAYIKQLTKRHWPTVEAMATGSPEAVATAMRKPPAYYAGYAASEEQKIAEYASAIRNAMTEISLGGGYKPPPAPSIRSSAPSTIGATLVLGIGAGMTWWFLRHGSK